MMTKKSSSREVDQPTIFFFPSFVIRHLSFLICSLFLAPCSISAQHTVLMDNETQGTIKTCLADSLFSHDRSIHTAIQPAIDLDLRELYKDTSLSVPVPDAYQQISDLVYPKYWTPLVHGGPNPGFSRAHRRKLCVTPIYDLSFGTDLKANRTLQNYTGGFILDADIKQKLGIEVRCASGISVLPGNLDSCARFSGMMPGYGDRAYALDTNGKYAFQHLSGNIIYRPSKVFNIQIGRDKHFWGDGYRSLFLSDCGMAMPYLKMQTTIWKLQYTSMFTWMQDWTNSNGFAKDFRSKFGTFHYIDFNANRWLNLGVFESIIFQGNDSYRYRGFDPDYLNPVIFYRPVEYSLGSSDNAMLGLSMKIRFNRNNLFYSQIILDEFYLKEIKNWSAGWWGNKQGIQMGYKVFNVGEVSGLNLQMEMNIVRPYTYTHGSAQQNYANAGMPLAHPLGANFGEGVGILSYSRNGFYIRGKMVMAGMGLDTAGKNYGQNIFLPYGTRSATFTGTNPNADYNHHILDGAKSILVSMELTASYRFNTKFPLRAELIAGTWGLHQYANGIKNTATAVNKSSYVQLGLSLPLFRTYRDY